MKVIFAFLIVFAASASGQSAPLAESQIDTNLLEKKAASIVQSFAKELKSELSVGMKTGGPIKAINICNTKAVDIAERHSINGWQVKRVSSKPRNIKAIPTPWEQNQLDMFEEKFNSGFDKKKIKVSTRVGNEYRFMKPIPVGKVCLACHGQQINSNVQATLLELYPNDKATGYKAGELRGAFSLVYTGVSNN